MINDKMFTSNSQVWRTPKHIFKSLNKEFNFMCDLFASPENALCDLYFTEEDSAFDHVWYNRNFANPPYETKIQNACFKRAYQHSKMGLTTVLLVPARTDTKRFHDYVFGVSNVEIRFLKGRLNFGRVITRKDFDNQFINMKDNSRIKYVMEDIGVVKYLDPAPFPSCVIIFKGVTRC